MFLLRAPAANYRRPSPSATCVSIGNLQEDAELSMYLKRERDIYRCMWYISLFAYECDEVDALTQLADDFGKCWQQTPGFKAYKLTELPAVTNQWGSADIRLLVQNVNQKSTKISQKSQKCI